TFAVWMTPDRDFRKDYTGWPTALAKLTYCDRRMAELADRSPLVTDVELDEDVGDLSTTLDEFYGSRAADETMPPGLDGALQAIFEDLGSPEHRTSDAPRKPAAELIRRLRNELSSVVFRWTGHFP